MTTMLPATETTASPRTAAAARLGHQPALGGHRAQLHIGRRRQPAGSVVEEQTLANERGEARSGSCCTTRPTSVRLGRLTGNQAVQQVKAGLQAIYLSGWQVAADANLCRPHLSRSEPVPGQLSASRGAPDQQRDAAGADQIAWANGENRDRPGELIVPIVADAEAGFGGPLNAFELMKQMIMAGAAGVHWEDQLASEKKCGHLGGKVLIPTRQHVRTLNAARLAADVMGTADLDHRAHRCAGRNLDHLRRRSG